MHIGVLGAAFDPPHLGHRQIITNCLEQQIFDEMRLVPVKQHPFGKQLAPDEQRLAMLLLMVMGLGLPVKVDTHELDQEAISYTYDTLRYFAAAQPEDTFSFIIGSDNVPTFSKWHRYEELLTEFEVYVYPRPGFPMTPLHPRMIPLKKVPEIAVSSTEIRNKVAAGQPITGLVPARVEMYIKDHQLYVPDPV